MEITKYGICDYNITKIIKILEFFKLVLIIQTYILKKIENSNIKIDIL